MDIVDKVRFFAENAYYEDHEHLYSGLFTYGDMRELLCSLEKISMEKISTQPALSFKVFEPMVFRYSMRFGRRR